MQALGARQHATGLTIIWATHVLALVQGFADAALDLDHERPQMASWIHDLRMSVSASRNGGLLVRIGPADTDAALSRPRDAYDDGRAHDGRLTSSLPTAPRTPRACLTCRATPG